ncbi:MAG TPA: hypothetical protein VHY19_13815 [Steroidobacteraceae bacterium]|jgi:hypothetical protein|nr:hypothetical protein [Steroidobacteraceae bacterium]
MSSASLAKMTPTPTPTPTPTQGASAGSATNAFVINLVSSTTPVALTRPDHAGLKRFTFFVSRRREEGRERFRLHMGYFDTQEEAEQLLDIVRTIYPGAWAGLAPGRRLAAAAAAAAANANANANATAEAPAKGAAKEQTRVASELAGPAPVAMAAPPRAPVTAATPTSSSEPPARPAAAAPPEMTVSPLALVPDEARRPLADVDDVVGAGGRTGASLEATPAKTPAQRANATAGVAQRAARHSLSNIRAAIASLEDSGIHSPVLDSLPTLSAAVIPVAQPVRALETVDPTRTLSNTATLRLLEAGAATREPSAAAAVAPAVSPAAGAAARPASAESAAIAKVNAANTPRPDKQCYAVQLVWSVQPIDMTQVPQLAIFSAYSLYGAEGNRDGRRWYGLRLGFFTDAVSAKQVAQYVRSDFATVSVVPVTTREREQALKSAGGGAAVNATDAAKPAGTAHTAADTVHAVRPAATAAKPRSGSRSAPRQPEFAFIEGTESLASKSSGLSPAATPPEPVAVRMVGGRPTRGAPGKRAKVRKPGQVDARTPVKPKTLEETLEILGANQLQVEDEQNASINDSGVGHMRPGSAKRPSKLSRLIGRLSERS